MITIAHKDDKFILSFPYNELDLEKVRNLPVRVWNKKEKTWEIPQLLVKTLESLKNVTWTEDALFQKQRIEKALLFLIDYKFNDKLDGFNDEILRPYQRVGVEFLKKAKRAILADDLGLGKTLMAITAAKEVNPQKVLVLVPATIKQKWYNEFKKHYSIEPIIISGNVEKRKELWNKKGTYYIANYELLLRDKEIMPKKWDVIIADELVYVKNPSSQRSKLAKKLKSEYKFGLSGYYIENSLLEFQSIFEWIRPEIIPNLYTFKYRYCNTDFFGNIIGYKNQEELFQMVSPFLLRREKSKVEKDLPSLITIPIELELDKKAEKVYNDIAGEFLLWLKKGDKTLTIKNVLDKTIKLREFVEFPEILGFEKLENAKLELLEQTYSEVKKIVVFTYFKESVEILRKYFDTKFFITGDVVTKKRQNIIDEFESSEKGMIILTDAGKFGIDLVSADTLFHFGFFYNPATIAQRAGRLHRIGQKRTVREFRPYYSGTIDKGILDIVEQRQQEIDKFIEGNITMGMAKLSIKNFESMIWGQ